MDGPKQAASPGRERQSGFASSRLHKVRHDKKRRVTLKMCVCVCVYTVLSVYAHAQTHTDGDVRFRWGLPMFLRETQCCGERAEATSGKKRV